MHKTIFDAIDHEHAKRLGELYGSSRLDGGLWWSEEDYARRVARENFRYEKARSAVREYYLPVDIWEHEFTGWWAFEQRIGLAKKEV